MRKDDAIRLRHMLDAANEVMAFARGRTRADLDHDRQLVLALVKDIDINLDVLWRTVQDDLPPLIAKLQSVNLDHVG